MNSVLSRTHDTQKNCKKISARKRFFDVMQLKRLRRREEEKLIYFREIDLHIRSTLRFTPFPMLSRSVGKKENSRIIIGNVSNSSPKCIFVY